MPTLNIGGRKVTVGDEFMSLSPEQQNATVEEISRSFAPSAASAAVGQSAPVDSIPDDVAKSAGIGVIKGTIGMAGLPGTLREAGAAGAEALGIPPEAQANAANIFAAIPMAGSLLKQAPSANTIQKAVEGVTGEFYKPKTTAGEYAQTVGEFAPGAVLPAAGIGQRIVGNVLAPALASETAAQLAKGTEAEPYARFAGGLLGGVAGSKGVAAAERMLERSRAPAVPAPIAADDLIDIAGQQYKSARNVPATYTQQEIDALRQQAKARMQVDGIFETDAPSTYAALDRMGQGVTPDAAGMMSTRRTFQNALGSPNGTERLAARMSRDALDSMIGGNAQNNPTRQQLIDMIKTADGNYAAAKRAQLVEGKLDAAEMQALGANSGLNEGNAIRQRLRTVLTNKNASRGMDAEDLDAIRGAIKGDTKANALRYAGNLLGGGGGLGALGTAAFTGSLGLPVVGSMAAAGAGLGLRKVANTMTRNAAEGALDTILTRAPAYQALPNAVRGGKFVSSVVDPKIKEAIARAILMQQVTAQ